MKRIFIILSVIMFFALQCATIETNHEEVVKQDEYQYPSFYKGVYINISPRAKFTRFKYHINKAARYGMNTVVLDTWTVNNVFKQKHFDYLKKKRMHAITRIVMFPDGLISFGHINDTYMYKKFELIEKACQIGFKEIQLDYIRFRDRRSPINNVVKAEFIESIVGHAKSICKKYNVKLSVDIFGRIPFTKNDRIGQRMEKLDELVDVICPMAYPSYYDKRSRRSEYRLIKKVIAKSKQRAKNAKVVLWIQGFKHKNIKHRSYYWFIHNQIKAARDSNSDGFIIWNAGRNYKTLYAVMNNHFKQKVDNRFIAMR